MKEKAMNNQNADTIRAEADALDNVSADVRDTMRSHADMLDSIDSASDRRVRQLVPRLIHDYYDLAQTLDECEERDAMHRMLWRKADHDLWSHMFTTYTTRIASACGSISDALDSLRGILSSYSVDSHINLDDMTEAFDSIDAVTAKEVTYSPNRFGLLRAQTDFS